MKVPYWLSSDALWIWKGDGPPAVLMWDYAWARWEGIALVLNPGETLPPGWKWCFGDSATFLPSVPAVALRADRDGWHGRPDAMYIRMRPEEVL